MDTGYRIQGTVYGGQGNGLTSPDIADGRSRREVAEQFERHLIEQFVGTMMESVFESGIDKSGPLASVGREEQKQVWVSQMAEFMAQRGGLGLAETLLRQWNERFGSEEGITPGETS